MSIVRQELKDLMRRSYERKSKRREATTRCLVPNGYHITDGQRKLIIKYFESGKYSIAEIARACEVTYPTAKSYIEKDPELKEKWETAFNARLDQVEEAMTDRAIDGRNEIAAQQAGEFLLKHRRRSVYADNAINADALKALPKIIIPMVINRPSETPAKPEAEVIDV